MKPMPALLILFSLALLRPISASAEQEVTLSIDGMTCELCAVAVEKVLESMEGIKEAKASYENKSAVVIASDEVSENDILDAVKKAGPYTVEILNKEMR